MKATAILILIFLGVFTGTALAGTAADEATLYELARPIFDAVMSSQWWAAAALAVVFLCAVARRYLPEKWKTGTRGDIIGTALAFMIAFAGAIGTTLMGPGAAAMSLGVAATAFKVGVAAIGGYTILHKLIGWLSAWGTLPSWASAVLKLLASVIGSNAVVKKAEAAGDKAVAANPPTGTAGDKQIVEVE